VKYSAGHAKRRGGKLKIRSGSDKGRVESS
jgi:hypothetical protein